MKTSAYFMLKLATMGFLGAMWIVSVSGCSAISAKGPLSESIFFAKQEEAILDPSVSSLGAMATPTPTNREDYSRDIPPLTENFDLTRLTGPELKAKMQAGFTTVIIPTGGVEQNGPYLPLNKHNQVVQFSAQHMAARLGYTLVAPLISVVPEGDMDHPTGARWMSGTLGVREETFRRLLIDLIQSLVENGFSRLCLLGDHGQSQKIQQSVAEDLNRAWVKAGVNARILQVSRYYDPDGERQLLTQLGIPLQAQGDHAGVADTAEFMAVNALEFRSKVLSLNAQKNAVSEGASGQPDRANVKMGQMLMSMRMDKALRQIREWQKKETPENQTNDPSPP